MTTTPAWLLHGLTRSDAGVLSWDSERLRFATAAEIVFDLAPADIESITWPKLWLGGGCKIEAGEVTYKVSFTQPNGAPAITDELLGDAGGVLAAAGAIGDLADAGASFRAASRGRAAGKQWRPVLDQLAG